VTQKLENPLEINAPLFTFAVTLQIDRWRGTGGVALFTKGRLQAPFFF